MAGQSSVKILVSQAAAEWLLEIVDQAPQAGCNGSYLVWYDLREEVLEAVGDGLRLVGSRPGACRQCGKSIYQTGWGRPALYCSDACKQAAYRSRSVRRSVEIQQSGQLEIHDED